MKNLLKVIGLIALVAVIGFGVIACDNGTTKKSGSPTPPPPPDTYETSITYIGYASGNQYKLKIDAPTPSSNISARAVIPHTPAEGDDYTLTITKADASVFISTGKVKGMTGSKITLVADDDDETEFTVTINNKAITDIEAEDGIPVVDEEGEVVEGGEAAPAGEFTPTDPGKTGPLVVSSGDLYKNGAWLDELGDVDVGEDDGNFTITFPTPFDISEYSKVIVVLENAIIGDNSWDWWGGQLSGPNAEDDDTDMDEFWGDPDDLPNVKSGNKATLTFAFNNITELYQIAIGVAFGKTDGTYAQADFDVEDFVLISVTLE